MAKLYNLAAMTVASTGTGTITLGAAAKVSSVLYLSFAAAGVADGETVAYSILDTNQSEVGAGVYTAAGTTLTRGPVTSTNGNAAINMTAAAIVRISPVKADIVNLRESNTFTGAAQTFNPPTGGAPVFTINQTISGTVSSTTAPRYVNGILISSDTGVAGTQVDGLMVRLTAGSTISTGARIALHGFLLQAAPQPLDGVNATFVGVEATAGLGGNGGGVGTESGIGIGLLGTVSVSSVNSGTGAAALNVLHAFGVYGEAFCDLASTVKNRIAVLATDQPGGIQGTAVDAAFGVSAQSSTNAGFKTGLLFTQVQSSNGNPMNANGTLIATSGTATVTGGIDWSSYTFTGNEFNSQNMQVTGAGAFQLKQNNKSHQIGTVNPSSTSFNSLTVYLPTDSANGGGATIGGQVGSSANSFQIGNESALSGSSIYSTGMGFLNSSSRYRFFGLSSGTVTTSSQGVLVITPATIDNLAWTAYSPTLSVSSASGTFTSSQWTTTGRFKQIGKTAFAEVDVTSVSNTSTVWSVTGFAAIQATLPTQASSFRYCGSAFEYGASFKSGASVVFSTTPTLAQFSVADGTGFLSSTFGNSVKVAMSITYETT